MNNNKTKTTNSGGGIGFCGLLTIAFIVLKLLGKITWSWVWVLSPLWICVLLIIFLTIITVVLAILTSK